MIDADPSITIVNKDQPIATLTEDYEFDITMTVGKGRGYVTATEHLAGEEDQEIGLIAVDSIYSPVTRVRYGTEDARVEKADYDRLAWRSVRTARFARWRGRGRKILSKTSKGCAVSSSLGPPRRRGCGAARRDKAEIDRTSSRS